KFLILDEPRPVQPEGRPGDPPTQLRHLRQSLDDQFAESLKAVVRRIAGIADRQRTHMHMPARSFCRPKRRINTRKPLHATTVALACPLRRAMPNNLTTL